MLLFGEEKQRRRSSKLSMLALTSAGLSAASVEKSGDNASSHKVQAPAIHDLSTLVHLAASGPHHGDSDKKKRHADRSLRQEVTALKRQVAVSFSTVVAVCVHSVRFIFVIAVKISLASPSDSTPYYAITDGSFRRTWVDWLLHVWATSGRSTC